MAHHEAEICGFLDIKFLGAKCKTQNTRKRGLASWKTWRRHWCSVRKLGPGLGARVQLDCGISNGVATSSPNPRDSSIHVPSNTIICRTRSRSRQFAFGVFPAKERKPLLYLAGNSEMESQRWMSNIRHLLRPRRHRIMPGAHCVSVVDNMHSIAAGLTGLYGDLVASVTGVFIKDVHSGDIIQSFDWSQLSQFHLTTAGRPEDVKCICVLHTTKDFPGGVGELHFFCLDAVRLLQDLVTQGRGPRNRRPLSLSEGDLRVTSEAPRSRTSFQKTGTKYQFEETTNTRAIENLYQPEPASMPNTSVSCDELRDYSRRFSGVSVASGIYEEILGDGKDSLPWLELPPPLPPRQKCWGEMESDNATCTAINIDGALDKCLDSSSYVPMSPRLKDTMQENDYVIMR